jgi:hypothetical protein
MGKIGQGVVLKSRYNEGRMKVPAFFLYTYRYDYPTDSV